ncbi:hypothetical protein BYT27DRAFT_7077746 [Phlegmacium glaucopus]|nr:hypothetical protein BYT27DRAFT_7077746 [Phlegmacium glaucopus]
MPLKSKKKPKVPSIHWSPTLVWRLIDLAQADENKNAMIGKAKEDNTSADSKVAVFKRVAQVVIPATFIIDGDTAGKQTQSKWDILKKAYRNHAARLIQTGGGLHPENEADNEDAHHKYADCYIPATGPDGGTMEREKNIWGKPKSFNYKSSQDLKHCL